MKISKEERRLRQELRDFKNEMDAAWFKVEHPITRQGPHYYPDTCVKSFNLSSLYNEIEAVDRLGYDVVLRASLPQTINVMYAQRPPSKPWQLRC
jgi:hypothetical protein